MSDNKSTPNADWGLPGFDFAKLVESCQISGVDMMSLIDMEKTTKLAPIRMDALVSAMPDKVMLVELAAIRRL